MRVETPDIYADLQQKLMNAAFRPGEKLKPADLQGTYGCSANTIREILLRLTNVGLVTFEVQHRPGYRIKLRMGVATGGCVAGVVGTKIPHYSVFGETVDVAGIMEATSEPMKIQVSHGF